MKKYDEIKSIGISFIVLAWLMLPLSIINILFINEIYLKGFIMGVDFTIIIISIIRFVVIGHNVKIERREFNKKYGFREDFDCLNRFCLKKNIKGYLISTVDLGINHNFFKEDKPLYYETMIFGKDDKFEWYQMRYSTKKQAKRGHKEAIKYVKKELKKKEVKDE